VTARGRPPARVAAGVLAAVALLISAAACARPAGGRTPTPAAGPVGRGGPQIAGAPAAAAAPSPAAAGPAAARPGAGASLAGKVVVLDPGHDGGDDGRPDLIDRQVDAGGYTKECDTAGTETDAGYPEHAFTFDVATRVAALLRSRAAKVILTRQNDTGVGPCVDVRAAVGNDAHAAAAISIHADGGPADGQGFHVIAPARAPDGGNTGILEPSGRLAGLLITGYARQTGEPTATYIAHDGLAVRSDLAGLNLSRVPKVFIECLNMRNAGDAARATSPAYRQKAARGIADGLAAFLTGTHS
jgi:N-acetylmuramoyl-L-alanine amidase